MGNIRTEIDRSKDLTINVVTGKVSISEINKTAQAYLSGNLTKNVLWDFSQGDASDITNHEFRQFHEDLARMDSAQEKRKIAIVVSRDLGFGLGRIGQAYAEIAGNPSEYNVVRSRDEAMAWLNPAGDP